MKAALVGGALLFVASPAWADAPALVFPLAASDLPPSLRTAPDELTRALADSIDAKVADVPLEDAAGLLECDPEATACLQSVASSMGAGRIVFGTIAAGETTTLKVTLTRFDPGPTRQQRTFELDEDSAELLAEELVRVAAPLFRARQLSRGEPMDRPPAEPEGPEQARGTVSAGTWGVIGSGAVVTGVGLGLWMSARGLRSEVEAAPRETRADLDALIALEEKGTFRTRLGGVLTAVGGAALAYGLYRGITERRRTPADRGAVVLTPVPIEHGAALVLTLGMP